MNFNKILYGGAYDIIPNDYIKKAVLTHRIKIIFSLPFKFIIIYFVSLNIIALNGIIYLLTKENMDLYCEALEVVSFKSLIETFKYLSSHTSCKIKCKNCGEICHYTWNEKDINRSKLPKDFCIKQCGYCMFKGETNGSN